MPAYDIQLQGGTGNDNLILLLLSDTQVLPTGKFLLDGGPGIDTALASDLVTVINCEK